VDTKRFLGLSPDALPLTDRLALTGKLVAFEIYTPKTIPLHFMEAIGSSVEECVSILQARGLDPGQFEFTLLPAPY
jgi:hypothetical protein